MNIDRHGDIPSDGPISDLLWSDPGEEKDGWVLSSRGAGYMFGLAVTTEFRERNGILLICRAHHAGMELEQDACEQPAAK